ncbi:MAG: M23 family metallopeptidase [Clostridiales bacterium]|nr:M23 family metallopeptidase [Clostridiales bacterium]
MWLQVKSVFTVFLMITVEAIWIAGMSSMLLWKSNIYARERKRTKQQFDIIARELIYFPVARQYIDDIDYEDTYGADRENGSHAGCDLMDRKNQAGRIPVISATDGVVTNLGWLYLGGYRIGITSEKGIYYYYAHLDSYAANMYVGRNVKAGELLGFMGNTGEGEEGTKGKFAVHLHFGIYINRDGKEVTVNPYPYLQKME